MTEKNILEKIDESKNFILKNLSFYSENLPKTAIIAGSGLSNIKSSIKQQITIPYTEIPYFRKSTVQGHTGELVAGKLNETDIFLFNGRVHYYEGYSQQEISYPVRVIKSLGVENLIITCAVGAVNKKYNPGEIVVIKDHINFSGSNPLIGAHFSEFGERFPDMTNIYNEDFRKKVLDIAKKEKIKIHEGIYFSVSGPSYETPAEIKAYAKLGADVIGMSLIAESIVACQQGIKVLALTYVSNKASGISKENLSHEDVLLLGKKASTKIEQIVKRFISQSAIKN